ncbi:unnamed protein product, partial [Brenthis ino]
MSKKLKPINSPRSRAPIDEEGVICWDILNEVEEQQQGIDNKNTYNIQVLEPKIKDKSTNTEPERETNTNKMEVDMKPNDIVLKKWRDTQSVVSYELAKKVVINSLKEKFSSCVDVDKVVYSRDRIADVEETSNSNVNHVEDGRGKRKVISWDHRVGFCDDHVGGVCHAKFQGPGGAMAQWKAGARGGKAGAAGGLRGVSDEMPVS